MDFSDNETDNKGSKWDKIHQMELEKLDKQRKNWGKNRDAYYNSDTQYFQVDKDNEAISAEEAEIKLIQREQAEMMSKMDLGLDSLLAVKKSKVTSKDDKSKLIKTKKGTKNAVLSTEERVRQVLTLSPELLTLLSSYLTFSQELQETIPVLLTNLTELKSRVEMGSIISIIKLRQQLLFNYCSAIIFYLYLKSMGKTTSNHPVIKQLLHLQTVLSHQDEQFNKIRHALLDIKLNVLPHLDQIELTKKRKLHQSVQNKQDEDDVFALRKQQRTQDQKVDKAQKAAQRQKVDITRTIIDLSKRRRASKKILNNVGLRRQKSRKQIKNGATRGKLRKKHEVAVTKRKSTVREYKGQQGSEYGGEATIKKGLIRSVKL